MKYSIYSLCPHDNFAIFHALQIRLILRVILSIACGGCFGGESGACCLYLPMIFYLSKKKKSEQSLEMSPNNNQAVLLAFFGPL